ncbi:hypothetical protein G6F46_005904 [Rhizopus delemar]|uniref:Uncharacterized protein n=2 Tax=Rhizopus TaxID=4842 RepID=A0A9P6YVG8_9FUNG|nr:hypothetical protein G6F53_010467 [Rhizopus delemar]KAG1536733.1 hypothetical protein G6F51_010799 [Rhizopus arrhizus]KAG1564918.1 hypothetical protein G6F50_010562 [Rhizopus delemar]KAG1615836.1 hypothetical protein G6F46_005904 [Rhizopus delemar]KAG1624867.1 hypothetical protein G6F45_009656 [Rhizopus arrhizus]
MSRRVAAPTNVPSNAPKRARVSRSIAGSSSTAVPSSSLSSAPAPAPFPVPVSTPVPVSAPVASFGGHTGAEAIGAASGFTPEMMAAQMQFLSQMWQQQQQQQLQLQLQYHPTQQSQQGQQYIAVAEINKIKKQCSDHIANHYRKHLVGRGIKFDTLKSITDKANRKVKNLLRDEVRKHQRFNCLSDSQIFTMIRSKFYYMVDKANGKAVATPTSACRSRVNAKLLNRRVAYNANAAAYQARFPFAEKILTVDWTSDEEDGPEDEDGRTFIVKRPSFRSERVVEFHKELQKGYKELLKKKGAPPTVRRRVQIVEMEFPDKLDHEYYPSWAFASPALGFPTSVSGSSSSAAANPMP